MRFQKYRGVPLEGTQKKLFGSFLLIIFFLAFLSSSINLSPSEVSASPTSEEEETDNFTTMPNYRWENQSVTNENVSEQLIGNNYEIYNSNNQTSGTQQLAKSRKLNSRDLYFNSRFAPDTGGDAVDYFRDFLGDACDFTEGDQEGFTVFSNGALDVKDGLIEVSRNVVDSIWGLSIENTVISTEVYNQFSLKIRGSGESQYNLRMGFDNSEGARYDIVINSGNLPTEWTVYTIDLTAYSSWTETVDYVSSFIISLATSSSGIANIDYIKLEGDLDYATHTESEVEDTWDWEDSLEFYYNELSNISDFNDGTTEDWIDYVQEDISVSSDNWLWINISVNGQVVGIKRLETYDVTYKYICVEVDAYAGEIDFITFYDGGANNLYRHLDNIAEGDKELVYGKFDGDWAGAESELRIVIQYVDIRNDHKTKINFTYLYDVSLGDLEGFSGSANNEFHVHPEGFLSVKLASAGAWSTISSSSGQYIDTTTFTTLKLRMQLMSDVDFDIKARIGASHYVIGSRNSFSSNAWTDYKFDLSADFDWSGICTEIYLLFVDGVASPLEGDEVVNIDYFLLIGEWSPESEFKFSLLNQNDDEGLSIGFNKYDYSLNTYYMNVSVFDSVGLAEQYSLAFNYSFELDGWLQLEFEFDFDKKQIFLLLEYENGSEILKARRITDLFYLGEQQLLLFEAGFPQICINVSTDPYERVYLLLEYIDANFIDADWHQPGGNFDPEVITVLDPIFSQDVWSWDAQSPYGIAVYQQATGVAKDCWYRLDVDRFDGVNFDVKTEQKGLDGGDQLLFFFEVYNVKKNATIEHIFSIIFLIENAWSYMEAHIRDGSGILLGQDITNGEMEGQVSFFKESPEETILQTTFKTNSTELVSNQLTISSLEKNGDFTDEWLFYHAYKLYNNNGGGGDDEISLKIGGYDLTRKDFLGAIASAVLKPLVGLFNLILTPLFFFLELIGMIIISGLKGLFNALSPVIQAVQNALAPLLTIISSAVDAIGDIIVSAVEGIGTLISDAVDAIGDLIVAAVDAIGDLIVSAVEGIGALITAAIEDLWNLLITTLDLIIAELLSLAEEFADFLFAVLEFIFIALLDIAGDLANVLIQIIIWFWESAGLTPLSDILAFFITWIIEMVTGIPAFLVDLAEWFALLGIFALVLWWFYALAIPFIAFEPFEAIGVMLERFFANFLPWEFLGFKIYFPQALVVIPLTYFLIIQPAGGMFAIW